MQYIPLISKMQINSIDDQNETITKEELLLLEYGFHLGIPKELRK